MTARQPVVYAESLAARRLAKDCSTFKKSLLKLGIMSTIAPDQIVDLIAAIRKNHSGLELALCDSDAKDLRTRLLGGELEVTIDAFPGEAEERIHRLPLCREQMMIVVLPSTGSRTSGPSEPRTSTANPTSIATIASLPAMPTRSCMSRA